MYDNEIELNRRAVKKHKVVKLTEDDKVVDNEVLTIMKFEIVRWMKFPKSGWNLWSEAEGSICKMICDKMVSWPTQVTNAHKKRVWDRVIAPRMARKLTVIKNQITQKMKDVFMSKSNLLFF